MGPCKLMAVEPVALLPRRVRLPVPDFVIVEVLEVASDPLVVTLAIQLELPEELSV